MNSYKLCQLLKINETIFSNFHFRSSVKRLYHEASISNKLGKNSNLTIARLMVPDDANILGNVHGGTMLKLMEEAGAVVAARYCNNVNTNENHICAVPTLARMERNDFMGPMFIGEVAEVYACVSYTSHQSLLVTVNVFAENVLSGKKRFTNRAKLWYVPVNNDNVQQVLPVPKLELSSEEEEEGRLLYAEQKKTRTCTLLHVTDKHEDHKPHSVGYSKTMISTLVGPSDVFTHGYCKGGTMMKVMDECAGITAAKHCMTPVVTASIDATNFLSKCKIGSLLNVQGVMTYTGNKSMEVQVIVDSEQWFSSTKMPKKQRAVEAFFTFVSLDKEGRSQPVPQIKIATEQERSRYEAAKQRYENRQLSRS